MRGYLIITHRTLQSCRRTNTTLTISQFIYSITDLKKLVAYLSTDCARAELQPFALLRISFVSYLINSDRLANFSQCFGNHYFQLCKNYLCGLFCWFRDTLPQLNSTENLLLSPGQGFQELLFLDALVVKVRYISRELLYRSWHNNF